MAFPHVRIVEFPQSPAGTVVVDTVLWDVRQLSDKGFDFIRDGGAAFTAVLQGSVGKLSWTDIQSLAASAQGVIPAHYNWVRINVTVGGALGTTTQLRVAGKEL